MIDTNPGQRHYFLYLPTSKRVFIVNVRDSEKKNSHAKKKKKTRNQEANTDCLIRENSI